MLLGLLSRTSDKHYFNRSIESDEKILINLNNSVLVYTLIWQYCYLFYIFYSTAIVAHYIYVILCLHYMANKS